MLATKSYGVRIDPELKDSGCEVLESVGLTFADGVKIFLTQLVNRGEFPLELKRPNSKTLAAMKELEAGGFDNEFDSLEAFVQSARD